MMKIIWHEVCVRYYLFLYNRWYNNNEEKRGPIFQRAYYHQEKLLDARFQEKEQEVITLHVIKE